MTAAVVLCVLHEAYEFSGLAGATSWRSVGLQYIATTDHTGELAERELLARAVDDDPGNDAALLGLWHARYRKATDPDDLRMYVQQLKHHLEAEGAEQLECTPTPRMAKWLMAMTGFLRRRLERLLGLAEEQASPVAEDEPLRLRARYALIVALVNLHYAELRRDLSSSGVTTGAAKTPGSATPRDHDWEQIEQYAEALQTDIESTLQRADGPSRALASRLKDPVAALSAMSQPSKEPDYVPRSPTAHYQHGCYLGTEPVIEGGRDGAGGTRGARPDYERALRHFGLADTNPELCSWRDEDPQLFRLKEQDAYRSRYGDDPVSTLSGTPTFAPYAERLRLMQLSEPHHVLDEARQGTLAPALGVTPAVAWHLARFAHLVLDVDEDLPRYDIAEALWAKGVTSVTRQQRPDLVDVVVDALSGLKERPTREQLEAWLGTATQKAAMNGATPSS